MIRGFIYFAFCLSMMQQQYVCIFCQIIKPRAKMKMKLTMNYYCPTRWQMHLNMNLCSLQCLPFFTVTSPGPLILGIQLTWGCACICHPALAGHTAPRRKWSSSCLDLWLPRKDDSRPRESNAGAWVIWLPTRVTACHWSVVDFPKTREFRPSWCDVSDQTMLTQFWYYYSNVTSNNIIPNSIDVNFVNAADEQTILTLNVTKHIIYQT